jgi:hypothetical protein
MENVKYSFDFEKGLLVCTIGADHALGKADLSLSLKWEGLLQAAVAATETKFDDQALAFILPLLKKMEA